MSLKINAAQQVVVLLMILPLRMKSDLDFKRKLKFYLHNKKVNLPHKGRKYTSKSLALPAGAVPAGNAKLVGYIKSVHERH